MARKGIIYINKTQQLTLQKYIMLYKQNSRKLLKFVIIFGEPYWNTNVWVSSSISEAKAPHCNYVDVE